MQLVKRGGDLVSRNVAKTNLVLPIDVAEALLSAAMEKGVTTESYILDVLHGHLKELGLVSGDPKPIGFDTMELTPQQEQWLEFYRDEKSVTRASVRAGIPTNSPYVWSQKSPAFSMKFAAARNEIRKPIEGTTRASA